MDTRTARALAYIDHHLDARLTIETLAAAVDLSPSRFAHLFRDDIGTSPAQYVHALRMLRARVLLERTFLSVKEVMAAVGCHDPSHFSRDFRSFHGVAPRQCRLGAARDDRDAASLTLGSQTGAAIAHVAALANEHKTRTRKPRPRARAPDQASHPVRITTNQTSSTSSRRKIMSRLTVLLVATIAAVVSTAAPASAQLGGRNNNNLAVPVVGTGAGGTFTGTFTLKRFFATSDGVAAVGLLTGVATPTGGTPTSIVRTVVVPAQVEMLTSAPGEIGTQQIDPGACGILHLDLGPLFLDLLGLQVDLSRVILDIAAAPGAGNLLGNLLCAVTGLLDGPAGGLAALLNQILGILG